jgi:hypothetical protein
LGCSLFSPEEIIRKPIPLKKVIQKKYGAIVLASQHRGYVRNFFDPIYANDIELYNTFGGSTYGKPDEYINRSAVCWADEINVPL